MSELKAEFEKEIENIKQEKKLEDQLSISDVRCLVRLLSGFVDVGYFDKTYIAKEVVRQANDLLDKDVSQKPTRIGEMLDYLNVLQSDAKLEGVRLLDANGNVCKAEELLLPTEINKEIFGYGAQYVLDLAGWQAKGFLKGVQEDQFQKIMEKLGVNQMLDEIEFEKAFQNGYSDYLASRKVNDEKADGRKLRYLEKGMETKKILAVHKSIMDRLENVELQKVLLFIASYQQVFEKLKESIELSFFHYKNEKDLTPYNYIRFQLSSLSRVKWRVFGANLILDDTVDVEKLEPDVKRTVVDVAELIRTDFQYETVIKIQEFLIDYSKKFPDGKNVSKLYKLIIDGWGERKDSLGEVSLYASDTNGKKEFHPSKKVFYTSNTCLPKRVIEKLGLFRLYYPTRQAANNITSIFGLFKIDDLNFKIEDFQNSNSSKEFDAYFRKLRPYFLLYAVQNASKDTSKATIAGYIKRCNIHLVLNCEYSIGEVHEDLDEGEFINAENDYYLKVREGFSIEDMKSSTTYCDAIMEILGMAFKLETKNEHFIHVFQNFEFIKQYIDDRRKEEIAECFRLLGLSPEETVFWKTYGGLKKLDIGDLDNVSESPGFYSNLGFSEQEVKKVDFSNWSNKDSIDFLEGILQNLEKSKHSDLFAIVNLSAWHKNRFDYFKELYRAAFVHKLWTVLNNETYQNKRNLYFPLQDDYSYLELESQWKHELKEDKDYLGCLNQKVTGLFQQNGITEEEIVLEKESAEIPGVLSIYSELFKSVQDQKDMGENSWWLYFEGNEESIKVYLETLKQEVEEEKYENGSNDVDVPGDIVKAVVVAPTDIVGLGQRSRKKSVIHTTKSDKAKARVGAMAEQRVDKFLRQQEKNEGWTYGEWVSKRNDSAGYDFTYLVDGQTRYLEVKASSPGNTFILTANEYEVAKKNIDVYDIAIVDKDGKVTIYQAFFKGQPRLDPKDYDVSFCLPQNP